MTTRRSVSICLVLLLSACRAEPFQRGPLPPLEDRNPHTALENFRSTLPTTRTSYDLTLLIDAPFQKPMTALAELVINPNENSFDLVALTPTGVTLFQLHNESIISAIPPLIQHKEILNSIAADIRNTFFNLIPSASANAYLTTTQIEFRQKLSPTTTLLAHFGGNPITLLDKHLETLLGSPWKIRYFNYSPEKSASIPHAIIIDHLLYRLILKTRSVEQQ